MSLQQTEIVYCVLDLQKKSCSLDPCQYMRKLRCLFPHHHTLGAPNAINARSDVGRLRVGVLRCSRMRKAPAPRFQVARHTDKGDPQDD